MQIDHTTIEMQMRVRLFLLSTIGANMALLSLVYYMGYTEQLVIKFREHPFNLIWRM